MKLYIAMNAVWKIVLEQFPLKQSVEIPRVNSKVTFQTIQFGNCNRNYHHHHHSPLHEAMAVATAYIWRLIIFVWFFFSKLFLCIEIEIITVFYFHFQFHFCFLSFGDSIFVSLIFAVVEICVHFICKRVKLRNSFGIFSSICGFFFFLFQLWPVPFAMFACLCARYFLKWEHGVRRGKLFLLWKSRQCWRIQQQCQPKNGNGEEEKKASRKNVLIFFRIYKRAHSRQPTTTATTTAIPTSHNNAHFVYFQIFLSRKHEHALSLSFKFLLFIQPFFLPFSHSLLSPLFLCAAQFSLSFISIQWFKK